MSSPPTVNRNDWHETLLRIDECPYVGPRPQSEDRDRQEVLIGRKDDLEMITQKVLDRALVILDGYSGVGKSSLLQNGLLARLRGVGFSVLVGREWSEKPASYAGTRAEVEEYLSGCITATHDAGVAWPEDIAERRLRDASLSEILGDLDESTGAVLILDQFEELLRLLPRVSSDVVRWVLDLSYQQDTRVVLSLRTDSMHLLDPLLRGVKPFSMDRIQIHDVSGADTIRSILTTSRVDPAQEVVIGDLISEEAVIGILDEWAREAANGTEPRLLDLQATLYALYFLSKQRMGSREDRFADSVGALRKIEADDVTAFLDRSKELAFNSTFAYGLYESIGLKVQHAEEAARESGFDRYLIEGAREAIKRAAPLLSSGGFKVPLLEAELTQRVLARELRTLGHSLRKEWGEESRSIEPIVTTLVKELRTTRHQLPRHTRLRHVSSDFLSTRAEDLDCFKSRSGVLRSRRTDRPESWRVVDVTAGPMMASSASETALEEVRRVLFAIDWLTATELVRRDPTGNLVLVHDGAGPALRFWESLQPETADYALHQFTAARGEHFVWEHCIGGDDLRVIPNLNWRDCRIKTSFRNLVFANCDFTGSKFDGCTFAGVTFVNCLLDDANFENCTIVGPVDLEQVRRTSESRGARLAPSFLIQTARSEASDLASYRGLTAEVSEVFSDTSGTAAIAGGTPREHLGVTVSHLVLDDNDLMEVDSTVPPRVRPTSGGVAVVGGRICFLTLYRCKSEQGGSVAFHHVSGDGLYIVEQGGRVGVHDGAVRGISVTRDIVQDLLPSEHDERADPRLLLEVNESTVQNVYFSRRLRGSAVFSDSIVMTLINASESSGDGFSVHLKNSRYQFVANTEEPDQESREDSDRSDDAFFAAVPGHQSRFTVARLSELAKVLEPMDFRFRNEIWELARRRENLTKERSEQKDKL